MIAVILLSFRLLEASLTSVTSCSEDGLEGMQILDLDSGDEGKFSKIYTWTFAIYFGDVAEFSPRKPTQGLHLMLLISLAQCPSLDIRY